jgi:hypothetical protein
MPLLRIYAAPGVCTAPAPPLPCRIRIPWPGRSSQLRGRCRPRILMPLLGRYPAAQQSAYTSIMPLPRPWLVSIKPISRRYAAIGYPASRSPRRPYHAVTPPSPHRVITTLPVPCPAPTPRLPRSCAAMPRRCDTIASVHSHVPAPLRLRTCHVATLSLPRGVMRLARPCAAATPLIRSHCLAVVLWPRPASTPPAPRRYAAFVPPYS